MSFVNIYCDKRNNITHLWSDDGYKSFPSIRYAYKRKIGGQYKSLYGDELEKITTYNENDPDLFESDISIEMKTLLDLYPNNDEVSRHCNIVIIDIEVDSSGGFPNIDEGDKKITAIALYDKTGDKYYSYILDPDKKITDNDINGVETRSFKFEEILLESFINKWCEIRPNIVSGWNSSGNGFTTYGFDIPYLYHRIINVLGKNDVYRLSPVGNVYQNKYNKKIIIGGVSCIDYLELYKKFLGVMKSSYSLANVAKDEELKHQKLVYKGSLNDLYKNDLHRYVEYNLVDVKVIIDLDKKYDFIYLARSICHKGHVPYEWYLMSSRWIDGAFLDNLHSKNLIGPNKPVGGREEYERMEQENEEGFIGAYVKESVPGLYDWVCSADIQSLYPSIIMSLNISNEKIVGKIENWDMLAFERGEIPIVKIGDQQIYSANDFKKMITNNAFSIASNGAIYMQEKIGVIPEILNSWFSERVEYRRLAGKYAKEGNKEKEEFYDRRQKREKIFLNSCYGILGLPVSRWYNKDNAEAVTSSGQTIIKYAEKVVNDYFNSQIVNDQRDRVIAVDTDSNYFSMVDLAKIKNIPPEKMIQFSIDTLVEICDKINRFYQYMVPKVFNVAPEKNRIKIVPDVVAKKALWIAKKRYALLKVYDMEKMKPVKDKNGNEGKLEVKGIDTVRSAFPMAFRKFLGEFLDNLLRGISQNVLDENIMTFEETINSYSITDLAKGTSVKFISNKGDINYNPAGRLPFKFPNGPPAQVKAALAYNDLLKIWKLDKQFESIQHGSKIKWVYLRTNDFCIDMIALKADDTDPDKILEFIVSNIDSNKQYDRELYSKLSDIYTSIKWHMPTRGSQLAATTFDFSDEW